MHQLVAVAETGRPIDVSDRRRDSQHHPAADPAERLREARHDLDLGARRHMRYREHVNAPQQLLMQYRGLASVDSVLVGLAGRSFVFGDGLHRAPADARFQSVEHGVHRHGKRQGRFDAACFLVAVRTPGGDAGKATGNRDVVGRGNKRNGKMAGTARGAVDQSANGIVGVQRGDAVGHRSAPGE